MRIAPALALNLLLFPFLASAAGISVTPSRITEEIVAGKEKTISISVRNPGEEAVIVELYPDEFSDIISLSPKSFTLDSGQKRAANLTVRARTEGAYATFLSVVAQPLAARAVKTGAGVKIPITFTVQENKKEIPAWVYVVGGIDILLLAGLALFLTKKKKRRA